MNFKAYQQTIRTNIATCRVNFLPHFDLPNELLHFRPANNGWSIAEILEHVALTSFYLLKLIDKGAQKSLRLAASGQVPDLDQDFSLEHMEAIGMHKAFDWIRPEHMEPTGQKPLAEVKSEFLAQMQHCEAILDQLPNGEGLLFKTTMTVNDLGKLSVYEYIQFLVLHAERHVAQMGVVREEWATI